MKGTPVKRWKYVGAHDAVDLDGVGTVVRDKPFDTDLDLSGREDFKAVKSATKKDAQSS